MSDEQMEQSSEQSLDWQREAFDWKKNQNSGEHWNDSYKEKEDLTYIRIVSPDDVSNDNRSIFKFQLQKKIHMIQ